MKSLLLILVVVAVMVGIVAALLRSKRATPTGAWPFYAKKPLSIPEQVLYFRLVKALPESIVLAQVQLSRLLGVKKGSSNYQGWLNRISQLSADFVVCAKDSSVLAVIELDDASHRTDRRREADDRKGRALTAAGVKLVRWQAKDLPDEGAIRSALLPPHPSNPTAAARRSEAGQ